MDPNRLKLILFKVAALPCLMLLCCTVLARGLRSVAPFFATRLIKLPIPIFRPLSGYAGWDRLDIANVLSIGLLLLEYVVLVKGLRFYLVPSALEDTRNWHVGNERTLARIGFWALLAGEALFFFLGVLNSDGGWGDETSPFTAVLGALFYLVPVVFVAYYTVALERRI